jgi:lipopolysaccharide/colanic/teichoic acid biosynthesis glycosyltransferase
LNIYPILLDSRPPYANGTTGVCSLLLLPLGEGTVLSHARARLAAVTPHAPAVFASVDADATSYAAAVKEADSSIGPVLAPADFRARLEAFEPSDWLLVVDPSFIPVSGLAPESLLRHAMADPRWARHLVALERSAEGTRERVDLDGRGRVRRIQRFYDAVTWPFTTGVSCSLLPASGALLTDGLPWASLAQVREALSSRGMPSRDLPIQGAVVNLGAEEEMLAFSERFVTEAAAVAARRSTSAQVLYVGGRHLVARTARLIGPVILQSGAVIEERATVLGPAVIGAGAKVGRDALVAQSVLGAKAVVGPGATVRHRVVFPETTASDLALRSSTPYRVSVGMRPGPALQEQEHPRRSVYASLKPVLEAAVATVALALLSPLLLLIAALVKLDTRGPAFYGHKREGKDGRVFRCWKFRTMVEGAQARERELQDRSEVDGPQFKVPNDPRLTRVGRWLRPASLDELPQLFNVVLGQMSLVGPRPSPFRENQLCVPWREGRLSVRPGITGLWQVCRHERSAGDFHQWIEYDLLYVRYSSLAVDLKILTATVLTGGGKGHVPLAWILPDVGRDESA